MVLTFCKNRFTHQFEIKTEKMTAFEFFCNKSDA
jgi:hypothetical protein